MRLLLLIYLFLTAVFGAFAQDTAAVKTYYKNGKVNEIIYRDSSGLKHGAYLRYTRYGKLYLEGKYEHGIPKGVWSYYSADTLGILVQKLDFDTHKELFVDTLRVPSLICGPRYFGGNMIQQDYIQLRIKTDFTAEERNELKGKNIMAVFEVDPVTLTTYAITVDDPSVSPETRQKIARIVKEMPSWLPPVCTGGSPVWRTSVVFVFQ